jgi:hypothetical protein
MARSLKRALDSYPPTVIQELTALETQLGGRQQIVGMLTLAPLTPDLRYLLGLLGDPRHQGKTLAEICALGNILPGELLKQLMSAALLKGKVLASREIGEGIAKVTADLMRRAAPYEDACHACQGVGQITPEPTKDHPNPTPEPCETCLGTGKLLYKPDLERQKVALEIAQLFPKSGGLQILNANVQGSGPPGAGGGQGAIERLQALTDRILYGSGPPGGPEPSTAGGAAVEGEVVEGSDESQAG